MKKGWHKDYERWQARKLSRRHYVYLWADGVYLQARMEQDRQCMLVIIGATADGRKELVGFSPGYRESKQSWRELLLDIQARGLSNPPHLAIGDGGMGLWGALNEVFPTTRQQRCWVHKTSNVLNKMAKSLQSKAKEDIHNIWMAENKQDAQKAMDLFCRKYDAKYPKATHCLQKDQPELLAFYDYPAEHWVHIRTTNPIESSFATVKHRTRKSRNCLSMQTAQLMVFTLLQAAQKKWLRLRGSQQITKIIKGTCFKDGIEIKQNAA